MKKNFTIALLAGLLAAAFCVGCSDGGSLGGSGGNGSIPNIDNTNDLQTYTPPAGEVIEEEKEYYTSKALSFISCINGYYSIDRPFTLDETNEYKRVYDNVYLYEYDYFYMDYDLKDNYCNLSDQTDLEYVEVEKSQGVDIQINVLKSGIYKIVFDVKTVSFDLEYKSEIETPVYPLIQNCEIGVSVGDSLQYTQMTKNPSNEDEFVLENVSVEQGKSVIFCASNHVSVYKVTLDASSNNTYASYSGNSMRLVIFNVGGTYTAYLNAKTYEVRLELTATNANSYFCQTYDGEDFITLSPLDESNPHIFVYQYQATSDSHGVLSDHLPHFYSDSYREYSLTCNDTTLVYKSEYEGEISYYFKKPGTYILYVNLSDFTVSVEKLPE